MVRYIIHSAYYRYPFEDRVIRRFTLPFLAFDTVEAAYEWIMRAAEGKPRYRVNRYWYEVEKETTP